MKCQIRNRLILCALFAFGSIIFAAEARSQEPLKSDRLELKLVEPINSDHDHTKWSENVDNYSTRVGANWFSIGQAVFDAKRILLIERKRGLMYELREGDKNFDLVKNWTRSRFAPFLDRTPKVNVYPSELSNRRLTLFSKIQYSKPSAYFDQRHILFDVEVNERFFGPNCRDFDYLQKLMKAGARVLPGRHQQAVSL